MFRTAFVLMAHGKREENGSLPERNLRIIAEIDLKSRSMPKSERVMSDGLEL